MTPDTLDRVRSLIASHLAIPVETIDVDSKLEDLGLDSLGSLELIFQIEEEFKVLVPNERASAFTTVRAVCDGIESLRKVPANAS